jgi:hypothetical protein
MFIATAALSSITSPAYAIDSPTKLYGVITDSTEKPLSGVRVSVEGPDGFSS